MRALEAVGPTEPRFPARHVARRPRGGGRVASQGIEQPGGDVDDGRRLPQSVETEGEDTLDVDARALGGDEPVDDDPGDVA